MVNERPVMNLPWEQSLSKTRASKRGSAEVFQVPASHHIFDKTKVKIEPSARKSIETLPGFETVQATARAYLIKTSYDFCRVLSFSSS